MTNAQSYTIKEMLEKMEQRSISDRADTNKKLDDVYDTLKDHVEESHIIDTYQDKRIGVLENWKSFVMGAVYVVGAIGAGVFIVFEWIVK